MSEDKPKLKPCPICGKPRNPAHAPFCSPRCADIDLGRWLKGTYVIPGRARDEASEDEDSPSSAEGE